MKNILRTLAIAAVVGFGFPLTALASAESCEKASKESAWYQSKAAALWSAYGGCRGVEWMGGHVKKHCEEMHHQAEHYQAKANSWHHEWVKNCAKD